jgi:hypothetical protein
MQEEDERCCGTGTCIIDAEGRCWCGQQWNGTTMCRPEADTSDSQEEAGSRSADGE